MSPVSTAKSIALAALGLALACSASEQPQQHGAAAPATASAAATTATAAAPSPFTDSVDDARLERYVGAYIKLQALQIQTQHQLDIAEETMKIAEIERAQKDAQLMSQAILSEAGFSEQEFLDLRHRLKLDPALNARGEAIFKRFMQAAAPQ